MRLIRLFAPLAFAALLLSGVSADRAVPAAVDQTAGFGPLEVRTRRLHMVRPDLLPYPIHYDTFC
jgi:hypothetical protein